jgi:DNA-binding transcriptional MerR regulator
MKADKNSKKKNTKNDPGAKGIRMKKLSEATGLPKSAILHYMAQGLLPQPVRTGPNMAYYDPACIERIKFIKSMQDTYSFPLSKIRRILEQKDKGGNVAPLIELSEMVFGASEGPLLNVKEFCNATSLDLEEVKKLIKNGLLLPLDDDSFNQQDVAIGTIYAKGISMGVQVSDMIFYAEAAQTIVDGEMRVRQKLTAHLPEDEDTEATKNLIHAARTTRNYVIDRAFQKRVASVRDLKDEGLTP